MADPLDGLIKFNTDPVLLREPEPLTLEGFRDAARLDRRPCPREHVSYRHINDEPLDPDSVTP